MMDVPHDVQMAAMVQQQQAHMLQQQQQQLRQQQQQQHQMMMTSPPMTQQGSNPFEAKTELKRSAVADVSGKSRLSEVRTSSRMFIHKNKNGSGFRKIHTVVSGGVHGPGKGVLKRPSLQKSSTNHRGSVTQTQATPVASDVPSTFFSKPATSEKASLGGKASLQPKRTPVTQEEIDAIMVLEQSEKEKLEAQSQ